MKKKDLKDRNAVIESILEECDECDYTREELENQTDLELLDTWLQWQGICGFTEDIVDVIKNIFGIDLNNE